MWGEIVHLRERNQNDQARLQKPPCRPQKAAETILSRLSRYAGWDGPDPAKRLSGRDTHGKPVLPLVGYQSGGDGAPELRAVHQPAMGTGGREGDRLVEIIAGLPDPARRPEGDETFGKEPGCPVEGTQERGPGV